MTLATEQAIADALDELQAMIAECRAAREIWQRERRAIIDLVIQHADVALLEAITARLEKSCAVWQRWPRD